MWEAPLRSHKGRLRKAARQNKGSSRPQTPLHTLGTYTLVPYCYGWNGKNKLTKQSTMKPTPSANAWEVRFKVELRHRRAGKACGYERAWCRLDQPTLLNLLLAALPSASHPSTHQLSFHYCCNLLFYSSTDFGNLLFRNFAWDCPVNMLLHLTWWERRYIK